MGVRSVWLERTVRRTDMQAIDHKTYKDYVEYNKARGYSAFPESLWNALKEDS